jgi:hypothetical protein
MKKEEAIIATLQRLTIEEQVVCELMVGNSPLIRLWKSSP